MNKTIITAVALAISATAMGQSKLDLGSRARLRQSLMPVTMSAVNGEVRIVNRSETSDVVKTTSPNNGVVRGFITLAPVANDSQLRELGVKVGVRRGNIVAVEFPAALLPDIEALDCVRRITVEKTVATKMDRVRAMSGIDKIHNGEGLSQGYTGKGVVAGIVDGGFDPNHVNFLDADGNQRIKQFTYFRGTASGQLVEERVVGDEILEIDTENSESFHATHTAGIMAGSYRDEVMAGYYTDYYHHGAHEIPNPYYGVAYEADICTASAYQGQLSDYYIAMGVESILNYAAYAHAPAVINLSLGSNIGPHDGTSMICRYLDELIADKSVNTIVCISAGNEGDMPIALSRTMKTEGETLATGLYAMYGNMLEGYQNPRKGYVYIFSDTDEPFEVQAMIVNTDRGAAALRMPMPALAKEDGEAAHYWCSSEEMVQDSDTDEVSAQFARYLNGYCGVGAGYDEDSGRYFAVIDFLTWDNVAGSNSSGKYILGFQVTGKKAGQRIDCYGDGGMVNFSSFGLTGYSDGEFNGTINDITTGHSTICVGSYNSRDSWASIDGNVYGYQGLFDNNKMSEFTSYGTLIDGRNLPHICAPGATVISSVNDYYLKEYLSAAEIEQTVQAQVSYGSRDYSWMQCLGTSMAAPVVTGTIALWLEAYPQLTAAEARKILMETATVDADVSGSGNPIQWGAGKLNAYEGLKRVLAMKNAGVGNVLADPDQRLIVSACGSDRYEVTVADAASITVVVTDLAGRTVDSVAGIGSSASVDLSEHPAGVYLINANGLNAQKIIKR